MGAFFLAIFWYEFQKSFFGVVSIICCKTFPYPKLIPKLIVHFRNNWYGNAFQVFEYFETKIQ
jgi:hypothetical protein